MGDRTALDTKAPALDIRARLVTTKLEMEAGRGDHQGRESGEGHSRTDGPGGEGAPCVWSD